MRTILSMAFIACLLTGCDHRDSVSSPAEFVDTTIVVKFGQQVGIPNTALSLKFDRNIYDGRLPSGMIVPWWTNTAQLGMTVMPAGEKMHLYFSGEIIDSAGVSFYGSPVHLGGFTYRMTSLTPLPIDAQHLVPDSALVAKVRVSRSVPVPPPDSPLFPTALGNRWIYADTTFGEDTVIAVSIDTFTIVDHYYDPFGEWWVLSRWLNPFYHGEIMIGPDSVFTRQSGEYYPLPGEPLSYASMELIPPSGDSSKFSITYEGDILCERTVKRLDSAVVTPCDTFTGTWEYRAGVPSTEMMGMQILKPGIGFVYLQYDRNIVYPYIPPTTQRMWLIEYRVY
ncbi:MAG: hypothetical protein HY851_08765 [candidate division Zixibacteria bacterium]|nr:hypothetical protein [candidate division Zixibacteria bacterium]